MAGKKKQVAAEGEVQAVNVGSKKKRTFSAIQWENIGTDPKNNGGWKAVNPDQEAEKEPVKED